MQLDEIKGRVLESLLRGGNIRYAFPEYELQEKGDKWVTTHHLNGTDSKKAEKCYIYKNGTRIIENGGESKSIFDLYMERKALSFIEALKELCNLCNITFPEDEASKAKYSRLQQEEDERQRAKQDTINALWAGTPEAQEALRYLMDERKFTEEQIKSVGFGLNTYEIKKKYPNIKFPDSRSYQITIPVTMGTKLAGFKVRTITGATPKYMNNEGLKKDAFFNIPFACEDLVIVEGELDTIKAKLNGFNNIVGTLGGKPTKGQIEDAIKRGVKKITLLFDADEAGANFTEQTIDALTETPIKQSVYVSAIPHPHKDIDDVLNTEGGKKFFSKILADAQPLPLWKFLKLYNELVKKEQINGSITFKDRADFFSDLEEILIADYTPAYDRETIYTYLRGDLATNLQIDIKEYEKYLAEKTARREEAKKNNILTTATATAQAELQKGNIEGASAVMSEAIQAIQEREAENKYASLLTIPTKEDIYNEIKNKPVGYATSFFFKGREEETELELPVGALTYICAPTSHGKSRLLENLALNIVEQGEGDILYFSYEEDKASVLMQLLNIFINTEVSANNLRTIKSSIKSNSYQYFKQGVSVADFQAREREFWNMINSGKIRVYNENYDSTALINAIKFFASQRKVKAVFIDYIQLLRKKGSKLQRKDELKEICSDLMELSITLQIPVVLASQLNREAYSPTEMAVQNIAEASDIEHSANIVLLLWNSAVKPTPKSTNYYKNRDKGELTKEAEDIEKRGFKIGEAGTMYAILAKNRSGERGIDAVLQFNGNTGKISYTATEQDEEDTPF